MPREECVCICALDLGALLEAESHQFNLGMSDSPRDEVRPGLFDWLNRILVVLIVLAIVAVIGLNYAPLIRTNQRLREKLQHRQDDVARIEAELGRLNSEIRALQTDPRHLERRVRELGYARPEELVVTFRDTQRP